MSFGGGHDSSNDDLFAAGDKGYGTGIAPPTANNVGTGYGSNQEDIGQSNRFTYGGYAGNLNGQGGFQQGTSSADAAQGRYQGLGQAWANQGAPQLNLDEAHGYMGLGDQARGDQGQALALMRARAMGQVPSVAQMQGESALATGLGNTMSQVASARGGPGAMALAARGGAYSNAALTGDVAASSAIAAAQERQAAEQGYFSGASGMRGQDYGAAGLAGGWAGQNAQLQGQNNALRLQGQLGFEGLGQNVGMAQLQAAQQEEALRQGKWSTQTGIDAASTQAGTQTGLQVGGAIAGAAAGGIGAAGVGAMSGGGAVGGPAVGGGGGGYIDPRNPYSDVNLKTGVRAEGMGAAQLRQGKWATQTATDAASTRNRFHNGMQLAGSLASAMGGAITSDAHAKEQARSEGVKEGMAAAASAFTPNMQPVARGHQDAGATMQTNEQPMHAPPPMMPNMGGAAGASGWQSPEHYPTMQTGPAGPPRVTPQLVALGDLMRKEQHKEAVDQHLGAMAYQQANQSHPTPMGVAAAPNVTSDELAKDQHESESMPKRPLSDVMQSTDADKFLDTLSPYSYKYKQLADEPTSAPNGGRYLGVIAQNVAAGPTGNTIVKDTPRGKVLEGGAMMSAMAAGLGRIHERMRELESQKGKR